MAKFDSSDILSILRQFKIAKSDSVPRHVQHMQVSHPKDTNMLIGFLFSKHRYYVLVDSTAEDDLTYITDQILQINPDAKGAVIANPNDETETFGLPFKGKDVYLFSFGSSKQRLDVWLAERNPDVSRSTWQKHIKAGRVLVNDEPELLSKYTISPEDTITITPMETVDHSDQELPIIYQDEHVIVVNKPAGILTHAKGELNEEFTVADFFARFSKYHADTNRPGIIHRLDRATSGLIVGALDDATAVYLQKQFSNRTVKKSYLAIVEGVPEQASANIDVPIGRNPSAPSTFRADGNGKSAQTQYDVVTNNQTRSVVQLKPTTGRTHQLRVHMAYINHPIVGDVIYGTEDERMYLHAESLELTLPGGKRTTFRAELPPDFKKAVDALQ